MRVLALVTDAFGGQGGIAQYNRDFLQALTAAPKDQEPTRIMVLPLHASEKATVPVGIHQMPPRRGRFTYSLSALREALTDKFDVVFCGHLSLAPLAALIARLKGSRLLIQTHGIEAWQRPNRLHRAAVEAADLVLCVSRHTRARVLSWAAIEPERVIVLPNTMGEAFTPGDASVLRARWGLEDKRVLLTVGRMDSREKYKGHDRVIGLLPRLIAEGYDVAYVIVGDGDDVARLKSSAVEAGIEDHVRFVGTVDSATLVDAYRLADLFVMPSTGEGFGIAFLEAMASGTPALGLAIAGARDALADGKLGATTTEAELVAAIISLLSGPKPDPTRLSKMVHDRFGTAVFAPGAQAAFTRLVQST